MLKTALMSGVSLVAMTTGADAAPLAPLAIAGINALLGSIGVAGVAAETALLTIGGTTVLTAGGAVGGALSLGLAAGLSLIGGGRQRPPDPGTYKNTFESQDIGRIHAGGRVPLAGLKIYGNTNGYDTYRYIALCVDPIDAIEDFRLGNRSVTKEDNGDISSPPFSKPGGSYVNIQVRQDAGTSTVWPELATNFPSQWDSSRPGHGFAQALVKYTSPGVSSPKLLKVRPSGWPDATIIARVARPYDPRTGDYLWTENAVLHCLHIALASPHWTLEDFNLERIAEEADKADALVPGRGGVLEPRARISYQWRETERSHRDVLSDAMLSGGIDLVVDENGQYVFQVIEENRPPEIYIDPKHILDDGFEGGPEGVERYNKVRLRYMAPDRQYNLSEIALVDDPESSAPTPLAWSIVQDEIDKHGERVLDIDLPYCPYPGQAQRIARRLFHYSRADRISKTMNMMASALWHSQTFSTTLDYAGGAATIEILSLEDENEPGRMSVSGFIQPYLATWNPATDEAAPPPALPDAGYDSEIDPPENANAAVLIEYPDASTEVRVSYPDAGGSMVVEAVYREIDGAVVSLWRSMSEYRASDGTSLAYFDGSDIDTDTIEFRHRVFNAEEDGSDWTETIEFTVVEVNTAPSAPNASLDLAERLLHMTAPAEVHVAYLHVEWTGDAFSSAGSININVRPKQVIDNTDLPFDTPTSSDQHGVILVTAVASDGTASSAVTISVLIHGSGGA